MLGQPLVKEFCNECEIKKTANPRTPIFWSKFLVLVGTQAAALKGTCP